MLDFPPLKIIFPYPLINQEDINHVSIHALLWGQRHGFWGFENLVRYAEINYHNDILIPLASLSKNEYTSLGSELLKQLALKCIIDSTISHQESADEVFTVLFNTLHNKRSPELLINIFTRLSNEMLFANEDEWTGEAITPYIYDTGPKKELISQIIRFSVKLKRNSVNAFIWDELAKLMALTWCQGADKA